MPKKGRKGGVGKDSCLMPFHSISTGALAAGVVSFPLAPLAFSRVTLEADVWAYFRVRKLQFRLLPTSPSTVNMAAGYIGGVQDTTPATLLQVVELLSSCVKGVGQTVPSNWCRPSRSELAGVFPWYKTVLGTADPTEEAPGVICIVGTGTESYSVEYRGVFEFKTAVNASNTPMSLKYRALMRAERQQIDAAKQRDAILKVLAIPAQTNVP